MCACISIYIYMYMHMVVVNNIHHGSHANTVRDTAKEAPKADVAGDAGDHPDNRKGEGRLLRGQASQHSNSTVGQDARLTDLLMKAGEVLRSCEGVLHNCFFLLGLPFMEANRTCRLDQALNAPRCISITPIAFSDSKCSGLCHPTETTGPLIEVHWGVLLIGSVSGARGGQTWRTANMMIHGTACCKDSSLAAFESWLARAASATRWILHRCPHVSVAAVPLAKGEK